MLNFLIVSLFYTTILLPINCDNRHDVNEIQLTQIGDFGRIRKARQGVTEHYHTGIDIKRPNNNYRFEPIFPIAEGKVISKRSDGPYAQLIVEHNLNGLQFWSLYEHIAGIKVSVGDLVNPLKPIARFMSSMELDRYGWQFDHFHLEMLKIMPIPLAPNSNHPERFFSSYSLICYSAEDLNRYYYNPVEFLRNYL
jgi:hypothetical protein